MTLTCSFADTGGDEKGLSVCDTERGSVLVFATSGDERGLKVCGTERRSMVVFATGGDEKGLSVCDTERRSMVVFTTGGDEKGLSVCDTEMRYVVVFARSQFGLSSVEVRVSRGGCFWSNLSRSLAVVIDEHTPLLKQRSRMTGPRIEGESVNSM